MANGVYDAGLENLLDGSVDWLTDDIKVVLVDVADYTVDLAADTSLADVPGAARVATSGSLTGKTVTLGAMGAADISVNNVTGDQFEAVVVYHDSGVEATSYLLAYLDTGVGFPLTPNGDDVLVSWDAGVVIEIGLTQRAILAFDDEAARLASVPQDGTLGWQTDTSTMYVYVDGATPGWYELEDHDGGLYLAELLDAGDASNPVDGDRLFWNGTGWDAGSPQLYSQFVYNSSGAQTGNRFNDWGDLYAALSLLEGAKTIFLEQDETLPAGAYNLDNVTLTGNGLEYNTGGVTVTFPTGVTVTSWLNGKLSSVRILSTSSGPVYTASTSFALQITNVSHVHSTTSPFFLGTGGTQHIFALADSGRFSKLSGGVENYDNTTAAFSTQVIISRGNGSTVSNDTLMSTNTVIYVDIIADPANDVSTSPFPLTHTNLVSFDVPLMFPRADATLFTAAGSISSITVQDAIEELDTDLTTLSDSVTSGLVSQNATGVTNVAAIADVGVTRYHRIGDVVFASGKVSVDPTTAGALTEWTVDLPVPELIINDNQGSGMAVSNLAGEPAAYARTDATTDAMFFSVTPTSGSVHLYSYHFAYSIV